MRIARGLSQRALADAAGITRQAVSAIERGRVVPGVGIALALARVLGTSVEELFAAAPPQGNSRPDSGLTGAGVFAPLVPPPPVLTGALAKELPRFDGDES